MVSACKFKKLDFHLVENPRKGGEGEKAVFDTFRMGTRGQKWLRESRRPFFINIGAEISKKNKSPGFLLNIRKFAEILNLRINLNLFFVHWYLVTGILKNFVSIYSKQFYFLALKHLNQTNFTIIPIYLYTLGY